MMSTTSGAYLRDLLTTHDATEVPAPLAPAELVDFSVLTSVLAGRLLARRFGTADDVRIRPFVASIVSRVGFVNPWFVEHLIRGCLGDQSQVNQVPPEQITGLHILVIATLLAEQRTTRAGLEELITDVEPLAREISQHVVHTLQIRRN